MEATKEKDKVEDSLSSENVKRQDLTPSILKRSLEASDCPLVGGLSSATPRA